MTSARSTTQFLFLVIVGCNAAAVLAAGTDNFEHFRLVWNWGPTFCRRTIDLNRPLQHHCNRDATAAFTIHGLWPTNTTPPFPRSCKDVPFDVDKIRIETRNELACEWQDLNDPTPEGFWEEQWDKHGTCAFYLFDSLPGFSNPQDAYFTKTIELNNLYDPNEVLQNVPNPKTGLRVDELRQLFQDAWGVVPRVDCHDGTEIFEISICLDKVDFQPIDCTTTGPNTVCRYSSPLVLPEGEPVSEKCLVYAYAGQ